MAIFLKKTPVIIGVVVVILIIIGIYFATQSSAPDYRLMTVEKGGLVQEVNVTGRVQPEKKVNLEFKSGGIVARTNVEVGDHVGAGDLLVELDSSELLANLANAKAALAVERAKLDELRAGTRQEEIGVYEAKVQNAKMGVEDSKENLLDKLQDAYTKSDDAIGHRVDQFFTNPKSSAPDLNFLVQSLSLEAKIESNRALIENLLQSWIVSLASLNTSSDLNSYINEAEYNLDKIKLFLDDIATVVNGLIPTSSISQTTIDGWRTDVSTARTNINTAITNLQTAKEKLNTAETGLVVAENELALKKAGSTPEQITAGEAAVKKAEASVKTIEVKISDNVLRAPIAGVITAQNAKIGEVVSAGKIIVSIISESGLKIEVDIPEADIAKVKIGNMARMTLDAYGDDVIFMARVAKIDPAETLIEGVASYKTTLYLEEKDDRILPGMTANLDIVTADLKDIIAVPSRAVISQDGSKFVRVLENGIMVKKVVKTGIRGSDGNIEITDGLNIGDQVITSISSQ